MTTTNALSKITIQAQADLSAQASRYRAVTFLGALVGTPAAGVIAGAAGILQDSSPRSGDAAALVYQGITKVVAGAAISTAGWPLCSGSGGYLYAATSGGATIGRAIEAAASGDLFQAFVDFVTLPAWNGIG